MILDALPARLAAKLQPEPTTGCYLWRGAVSSSHRHEGYGSVYDRGQRRQAHLVVWEHLHGPLPAETPELDHVQARGCASKLCCNDAHLQPVTRSENNRRSTCHHHPKFKANHRRRSMQRVYDVGIGLAVAWARLRGVDVHSSARVSVRCDSRFLLLTDHIRMQQIYRGSVVVPEPLHNHRVAFGIAMAQRGPWEECDLWIGCVRRIRQPPLHYASSRINPGSVNVIAVGVDNDVNLGATP